jgi:hypothetical protein
VGHEVMDHLRKPGLFVLLFFTFLFLVFMLGTILLVMVCLGSFFESDGFLGKGTCASIR